MESNGISIFLLVRSLEAGGAERQLVELARGLRDRGWGVTVGVFYKRGSLLVELERAGVLIVDLRKRGRWDVAGFLVRTALAIRKLKPDVIYSFLGGANLVAAAVRLLAGHAKLVWSIRASNMDLSHYDWLHRFSYALECRLSRIPDVIIANSHAGEQFAVDHGFPRHRILTVPNGIDTVRFQPDLRLRRRQRHEWGINETKIVVGVLARLDPMKGHDVFLRAAAALIQKNPEFHFVIVGSGSEEQNLKQVARRLSISNALTFQEATDQSEAVLNGFDIYCSPSIFGEGFSNSVAEAMACGVPCVVTAIGDSACIVGETGGIVTPGDPIALQQAIVDLRNSLSRRLQKQARRRIVELYSVGNMVERTIAALQSDKTGWARRRH